MELGSAEWWRRHGRLPQPQLPPPDVVPPAELEPDRLLPAAFPEPERLEQRDARGIAQRGPGECVDEPAFPQPLEDIAEEPCSRPATPGILAQVDRDLGRPSVRGAIAERRGE